MPSSVASGRIVLIGLSLRWPVFGIATKKELQDV